MMFSRVTRITQLWGLISAVETRLSFLPLPLIGPESLAVVLGTVSLAIPQHYFFLSLEAVPLLSDPEDAEAAGGT